MSVRCVANGYIAYPYRQSHNLLYFDEHMKRLILASSECQKATIRHVFRLGKVLRQRWAKINRFPAKSNSQLSCRISSPIRAKNQPWLCLPANLHVAQRTAPQTRFTTARQSKQSILINLNFSPINREMFAKTTSFR